MVWISKICCPFKNKLIFWKVGGGGGWLLHHTTDPTHYFNNQTVCWFETKFERCSYNTLKDIMRLYANLKMWDSNDDSNKKVSRISRHVLRMVKPKITTTVQVRVKIIKASFSIEDICLISERSNDMVHTDEAIEVQDLAELA